MTRTKAATVVALVLIGGVVAFFAQLALAAASQPKFVPVYSVAFTLMAIAVLVIALALPIRRATRSTVRTRIDPFHATRVVLITKASSIVGALLTGLAAGLIVELLLRSVGPGRDALLPSLAALGGAIVLLVAGLVGEWLCTVPPGDDDDHRDGDPLPGSLDR